MNHPMFALSALLLTLTACYGADFNEDTGAPEPAGDCREVDCSSDEVCVESSASVWTCEVYEDWDGDGSPAHEDCNDTNSTIYPGAPEYCDDVDRDCDGIKQDDSCADLFGVRYRISVLDGSSPYRWDDVSFANPSPDMFVEYGPNLPSFNQHNCVTREVSDSETAEWYESCDFTIKWDDDFKFELRDQDAWGSELIYRWEWEGIEAITEFVSQAPGEFILEKPDSETSLRYRIERMD